MGGVLRLPKNNLNLPKESFRLQIKDLAEETRIKFARKGLSDIFDILSEAAFLMKTNKLLNELMDNGFITYFNGKRGKYAITDKGHKALQLIQKNNY